MSRTFTPRRVILLVAVTLLVGCGGLYVLGTPPDLPEEERGQVAPEELAALFDRATSVSIREGGEAAEWWPKTLYRSSDRADIDSLKHAIRVDRPPQPMACKCLGSLSIRLYRGPNCIAEITNHHARFVRTHLWKSDGKVVDSEAFLRWCDERGIADPRTEWDESERNKR